MLYVAVPETDEGTLYLDVLHVERGGGVTCLSALVGDGCDEGEVLLEVGREVTVTFADLLPDSGLPQLLRRYGRESLRQALVQAAASLLPAATASRWPHRPPVSREVPGVCEAAAGWC